MDTPPEKNIFMIKVLIAITVFALLVILILGRQNVQTPAAKTAITPTIMEESPSVTASPTASSSSVPQYQEAVQKNVQTRLDYFKALPQTPDYSNWTPYTSQENKYKIMIPLSWRLLKQEAGSRTDTFTNFPPGDEKKAASITGADIMSPSNSELLYRQGLGEFTIDVAPAQPAGSNAKDSYDEFCLNQHENTYKNITFCVTVFDPPVPSTGGSSYLSVVYYIKMDNRYATLSLNSYPSFGINDQNRVAVQKDEDEKKSIVASFEFLGDK